MRLVKRMIHERPRNSLCLSLGVEMVIESNPITRNKERYRLPIFEVQGND
jgi:hypothetical protein